MEDIIDKENSIFTIFFGGEEEEKEYVRNNYKYIIIIYSYSFFLMNLAKNFWMN